MHTRENALHQWLKKNIGDAPFTLSNVAGDASFRRYFRIHYGDSTRIIMDAPPDKETILPFIHIAKKLSAIGVHTPFIYAVEENQGFMLLEDLGDQLLLNTLTKDNSDLFYRQAMETLLKIQQSPLDDQNLPSFDEHHMQSELALFREWFLQAYLNITLNEDEETLLEHTFKKLTAELAVLPKVLIHRDFHSRNLMVIDSNKGIGVLDFQDAMSGPIVYDLVSLLKDCYIQWPREKVIEWLRFFYQQMPTQDGLSLKEFTRAFDCCGLQRHLKVLGIFSRLYLRDNKDGYLRDLPLVMNYVNACLESYEEFHPFYQWMQERVCPLFAEKHP